MNQPKVSLVVFSHSLQPDYIPVLPFQTTRFESHVRQLIVCRVLQGTHDSFYRPIDNHSTPVPSESSLRPKSRVPIAPSQASTFDELSTGIEASNYTHLSTPSVTSNAQIDPADTAIYANLDSNSQHFVGATGYQPSSASIKNCTSNHFHLLAIDSILNCFLSFLVDFRVNRSSAKKEGDEVDHLTDLLVKSMENSAEPDFFGMI